MDKFSLRMTSGALAIALLVLGMAGTLRTVTAQVATAGAPMDDATLLEGFRHTEVASVSDAIEQLTAKRMYMSHRMSPIFTSKFAGFALTVKLKKDEGNNDPTALSGMLAAIAQ